MASDSPGSVVVLDAEQPPAGSGFALSALIRVDLSTGDRTVLSLLAVAAMARKDMMTPVPARPAQPGPPASRRAYRTP
jgi:hypothetical protein